MKRVNLEPMIDFLPSYLTDAIFALAKNEGHRIEKLDLYRIDHSEKAQTDQLNEGSRAAIKYVSTRTLDRDKEIVVPRGINLAEFRKYSHVLINHNYSLPPIGSDEWIKADAFGIKAKTIYADTGEGTLANIMWHLVQQGHQKASSIGFVPVAWTEPDHNDWDKVTSTLKRDWDEFTDETKKQTKRIITKSVLLEHSDVSVPANIDANVLAVAKSFGADDKLLKQLGWGKLLQAQANEKRVIPFRDLGIAPEDESWNGPREVAMADIATLRRMSTWFDSENAGLKSAYKLPHHKEAGKNPAVWRGVRQAMGILFGARGGVKIPSDDRRGVYDHLARHYRQFDREAPEFRGYDAQQLKTLFPDLYRPAIKLVTQTIRPVERTIRIVKEPEIPTPAEIASAAVQEILDRKRGILR